VIIDGAPEPLLAAQVSLGHLHRNMPQTLAEAVANNPARPKWKANSFFRQFAQ
jgi:hypothetical protein